MEEDDTISGKSFKEFLEMSPEQEAAAKISEAAIKAREKKLKDAQRTAEKELAKEKDQEKKNAAEKNKENQEVAQGIRNADIDKDNDKEFGDINREKEKLKKAPKEKEPISSDSGGPRGVVPPRLIEDPGKGPKAFSRRPEVWFKIELRFTSYMLLEYWERIFKWQDEKTRKYVHCFVISNLYTGPRFDENYSSALMNGDFQFQVCFVLVWLIGIFLLL